ncbi:hypothetical protein NVIRPANT_00635 [Pantoea sp. Nvir]|nr:hypothetical protein NVIRPANT_00635 [Pantoea sp. Nvir]
MKEYYILATVLSIMTFQAQAFNFTVAYPPFIESANKVVQAEILLLKRAIRLLHDV